MMTVTFRNIKQKEHKINKIFIFLEDKFFSESQNSNNTFSAKWCDSKT